MTSRYERLHRKDVKKVDAIVMPAIEQKESFSIEYRVIRADGGLCWVFERGQCIFDDRGKALNLDGVIVDVTARKEAEKEVLALREILPICSYCKQIRNDEGYYEQLEGYITKHSGVGFTHGICPQCTKEHFGDLMAEQDDDAGST